MRTRLHISLNVADLDASIAFYTRLFGRDPSKVREDYANWRLDEPALHLALVSKAEHWKDHEGEHLGIELFETDDLQAWRGRAEAAAPVA